MRTLQPVSQLASAVRYRVTATLSKVSVGKRIFEIPRVESQGFPKEQKTLALFTTASLCSDRRRFSDIKVSTQETYSDTTLSSIFEHNMLFFHFSESAKTFETRNLCFVKIYSGSGKLKQKYGKQKHKRKEHRKKGRFKHFAAAEILSSTNLKILAGNSNSHFLLAPLQPPEQDDDVRGPAEVGDCGAGGGPRAALRRAGPGRRHGLRVRRGLGKAGHCQVGKEMAANSNLSQGLCVK